MQSNESALVCLTFPVICDTLHSYGKLTVEDYHVYQAVGLCEGRLNYGREEDCIRKTGC